MPKTKPPAAMKKAADLAKVRGAVHVKAPFGPPKLPPGALLKKTKASK